MAATSFVLFVLVLSFAITLATKIPVKDAHQDQDSFQQLLAMAFSDPCAIEPCLDGQKCKADGQSYECLEHKCELVRSTKADGSVEAVCACEEGFHVNQDFVCLDIDECKESNPCINSQCTNIRGSYNCTCKPGFERQDKNNCVDIDECTLDLHNCTDGHSCVNTMGGFFCNCSQGYKLQPNGTCLDIDECELAPCPGLLHCFNEPGSYKCGCKDGFTKGRRQDEYYFQGDERLDCKDINECQSGTVCTGQKMTCINTVGGYTCGCVAEWSMKNGTCVQKECYGLRNEQDGCYCPVGFHLNTTNPDYDECQDYDECKEDNGGCYKEENFGRKKILGYCINTFGGHHCIHDVSCPTDYVPHPKNKFWCTFKKLVSGLCRVRPQDCRRGFVGALSILHSFVVIDPHVTVEDPLFTVSNVQNASNFKFTIRKIPRSEMVSTFASKYECYEECQLNGQKWIRVDDSEKFKMEGSNLKLISPLKPFQDVTLTIDVKNQLPFTDVIHTSIVHIYVRGPNFGLMPEVNQFMDPATFQEPGLRHLGGNVSNAASSN